MANKMIWVRFAKEGIHCYPDAPDDVAFLRNPHRHIFEFKVWIEIFHNDRDIEFIQFKRKLEALYDTRALQLDNKSCEMISDELHAQIRQDYPGREIRIEVSEDGENGSLICYHGA